MTNMANQAKWVTVLVAAVWAGAAQAALKGRDINGNAVAGSDASAVFLYDTDSNITWLRDANVNGLKHWADASNWANNLVVGNYSDWRLPTARNADGSGPCSGINCTDSEMGHLWYSELGNHALGPMSNTGDFLNLQSLGYWSGTLAPNPSFPWIFGMADGSQHIIVAFNHVYAMAVRQGDVAAVPEAQTYALMLAGLGVLSFFARRRERCPAGNFTQ